MSSFISRAAAVRLVVLLVTAAVSFSVVQLVQPSSSETHTPRAVPGASVEQLLQLPVEQPVEASIPVGPTVTPAPPAPAPVATREAKKARAGSHVRHGKKRHAGHRAHRKTERRAHHKTHARSHAKGDHKAHAKSHHKAHAKGPHKAHKTPKTSKAPQTSPQSPRAPVTRHHPRRPHNHWRHAGGRDISWPQCPTNIGFKGRNGLGQPMPDAGVSFVVVGLTNGRAFTPNPCLGEHLTWVRNHRAAAAAYAFAAFPSRAQLRRHRNRGPYDGRTGFGALKNAGHAAAAYNIRVMRKHGFTTPHVWLDVEPSSSHPWSHRRQLNKAVVRGWIRGYRDAGYTVGVYSTPLLWRHILGGFRPGLPEWRTAGPASPAAALGKCGGESIQGGPAVIAQWWTSRRDYDRLCPSPERRTTMETYFHQW